MPTCRSHRPREFFAYAKANRGKLSVAFDTTAGAAAFAAKLLNRRADLGLIEVPYRSAAQMSQDVASGVTQVLVSSVAAANAVVQSGKVRRIAIMSEKRFPGLPDLPSLSETMPGMVMDGWFGVVAPAGTPADIVARLNREIGEYLKGPEIQKRLLVVRPRDRGRRNAGKHRRVHQAAAGTLARAGEGAGDRAAIKRARMPSAHA